MKGHRAKELFKKYKEGSITAQERAQLESWYLDLTKSKDLIPLSKEEIDIQLQEVWNQLPVGDKEVDKRNGIDRSLWNSIAKVAAILIFSTLGAYFIANHYSNKISPGRNTATLTLDNGQVIILSDAKIGTLAEEGQVAITKTSEGQIAYQTLKLPATNTTEDLFYNTLSTPLAGQYQLLLPDGTKVWLNSLSSIRFPSTFLKEERVVEITGEVYFEVAKVSNAGKRVPFKVRSGNQTIEVLGTRFNINSYKDNGITETTLVEGSIRVHMDTDQKEEVVLEPGQQIRIAQQNTHSKPSIAKKLYTIEGVNTKSIVSWKDGYFCFDNLGLKDLMSQISRWYDIEVVYETPVKEYEFMGKIERSAELSKVLKIIELGGVRFKIEGRKIIVL